MVRVTIHRAVEYEERWLKPGATLPLPEATARLWARVGLAEINPPQTKGGGDNPSREGGEHGGKRRKRGK